MSWHLSTPTVPEDPRLVARRRRRRAQLEIVLDQVLEAEPEISAAWRELQLAAKTARPYLARAASASPRTSRSCSRFTAGLALHRLDEAIAALDRAKAGK